MSAAALANAAWLVASLPAWNRFCRALREPESGQREVLRRLIASNVDCEFGRSHGFAALRSYEEFRERVPVVDYQSVEPWVASIMRGSRSILTHGPVTRLLPTSGTTSGRKLIPFTASFQRELNAAIGPWMIDLFRQHPTVAAGPAYWSISPALPVAPEESAVPIGFDDDSAFLGGLRQRLVETVLAVPPALRMVEDMEAMRYFTLLCLLRQRGLRLVSVWHPSFFTLLLDALPVYWDELLRDVEHGSCHRAAGLSFEVGRAVNAKPHPRRATELRRAGPANFHALWPHLRVVSCWTDAQAARPAQDLQRRLPGVVIQSKGLLATEAVVSIPFQGLHPLAVCSHFYEFIDDRCRVCLVHELQRDKSYRVVVTTGGGLWRYQLGDLVEVDGFVEGTPSLRFLGRGGNISDICGEKLAEAFVTRALEAACVSCESKARFAMLAPENSEGRWHYTLFIEGEASDPLAVRLDTELRENPHYALCRDLGQLGPLQLVRIHHGAYETFCAVTTAEGRKLGDVKPQSLSLRADWRTFFKGVG